MVAQLLEAIEVKEVPRLRAVIVEAQAFGLEHPEDVAVLEEAVVTMQHELWPQARQGLAAALERRELQQLTEALAEAELVGAALGHRRETGEIVDGFYMVFTWFSHGFTWFYMFFFLMVFWMF